MSIVILVMVASLVFIFGVVVGFVVAILVKNVRSDSPSGILHISKTVDKDYYTIEITDDLDDISNKKAIVLAIDSREINIRSNEQ